MVLGGVFLLAYSGGLVGLWGLQQAYLTEAGLKIHLQLLRLSTVGMAVLAWLTAVSGAYIIYPWYRKPAPPGGALSHYPQALLKASPLLREWHFFGMEWKEHVAWLAPITATAVAWVVWRHGAELARNARVRRWVLLMYTVAFVAGSIAGALGAMITKAAPVQ